MILATVTSQASGSWTSTATWDTGTVPTDSDDVVLRHAVTIPTASVCGTLTFRAGGGISFPKGTTAGTVSLTISGKAFVSDINFYGDEAVGTIRTDCIRISCTPGIYCRAENQNGIPVIRPLVQGEDVIISDPGYISAGSTLQDIRPEGCARAYARKVSNNVRYATVTVMIRATNLGKVGALLRMAECPYPVLLATDTFLLKGFVETVATDASSVGKEFIAYKVTVAEAL